MNKLLTLLACTILLSACTSENKDTRTNTETKNVRVQKVMHAFSDPAAKDSFEVRLEGDKPENMLVKFTITTSKGEKIYDLDIKATDLLGSTDPNVDLRKESAQVAFIQNVVKEFLAEDKFLVPAVTEDQTTDDYAPDKPFYEELRKTKLNGFTYRLGKENNYYIAWSVSDKKVKVYYNCC